MLTDVDTLARKPTCVSQTCFVRCEILARTATFWIGVDTTIKTWEFAMAQHRIERRHIVHKRYIWPNDISHDQSAFHLKTENKQKTVT